MAISIVRRTGGRGTLLLFVSKFWLLVILMGLKAPQLLKR